MQTNPTPDALVERLRDTSRYQRRAGYDADADLTIEAASTLTAMQERIERLESALGKCQDQFEFMGRLASGSRVYEVERATGKRVRKPLGEVISSECDVAALFARTALGRGE